MKTIIAGTRTFTNYKLLSEAMENLPWQPSTIISGAARGADKLGERWAKANDIPIEQFPADWQKFGKSAGYRRNVQMAEAAEALVAFWDGKSRGTNHMLKIAKERNLKIEVVEIG